MELPLFPYHDARLLAEDLTETNGQKKLHNQSIIPKTSIVKTSIAKILALGAALFSSAAVFANTDVAFTVNASSPSFTLASSTLGPAGCNIRAGLHRYDSVTFRVNSSGNHNVSTLSLTGMRGDNFIAVYSGVFNPQAPTSNVIGCNDDGGAQGNTRWAQFSTNMTTGSIYTGVVTSFNAYSGTNEDGSGSYRISPAITLVYTLSGTISGLGAGKTTKIRVNGGTETTISANGSFTSTTALDANTAYTVTLSEQPVGQECTLTNATGNIGTTNVSNIGISCANLPTYTLTYDTQGGSAVASQTDIGGATITLAAAPTLANYTFTGWNTNSTGTGTNYSASSAFVMPSSATTLYAIWTINTVTLTFDANGGSSVNSITGNIGSVLTAPASPTRVGYSFTGWNPTLPSTLPATNTTYTAQWQINSYSLSFDSNGGSSVSPITADFGSSVTAPSAPTRTGYTFSGWSPALPSTMPAANTSYTAQWQINSYSLSFDSNGGSSVSPINANFGTNVTAPAAPTRTGYTFTGWNPALPSTVPAANTSYTAQWQINSYSLSFDSNGGSSVSPITADFGSSVTAPSAPTRTGYTFSGWSPALPSTVPAANTSYTAQWQINSYSLSFDSNGGSSVSPITADFGSSVTAPSAPTRTGYTFSGWSPALPSTVPAANTSYTAQWQVNSYSLSFDSNGGSSVSPITADFGSSVTAPSAPTRTGYTFSGWSPALPSTVPASNTSYTAQWQINSYSLSFDSNGGSSVSPINANFGTNVTAPAAPTRTGYTFTGWNPALPSTVPAANTSYTAQWQINRYNVSVAVEGKASVSSPNFTVEHGQTARITITADSDQYLTVASNCQASVQGRELFIPTLTTACQVRITAFDSVVADAQNSTAATVNEARTLRLSGGAGDKTMQMAAVTRAGQREVLTNEQAAGVLVKQADGSYRFSAKRTGRYSFDFVDAVSGERVSVNFDVLPYVAFSSSQQPGKLTTAAQIGVFLSDDAIEYPVTVSVEALGVDGVPAVFEIQAADERRKDYRFTPISAEQNKLSLQAKTVQNAIVGTPAVHTVVMQTTVLPISLNAMTSQDETETLVVNKQAGMVKVLTQTSSVGNFTYEFSAQGIAFVTQAGVTTFDPSLLAAGRYNIKVSAQSDDGRVGVTELSVRVIDSCPLASCDAISAVGIPTQVNPQAEFEERLPLCPQQAQGNRVQSCEGKQSDFIEAPAGYLLGLGRVADAQSWSSGQFGGALTETSVPDAGFTQRGYRVNFDVQGLENPGEAVPVVIPLPDGVVVPSNAVWRKLIAGKWQNFVSNSANRVDSAMRDSQGLCPTVASNVWQSGLIAGMQCVRLTIQDGGPNDDDQTANSVIRDPGVLATVNQYTLSFDSAGGSSVAAIKQDFGSVITAPSTPTRTGFTFTGWSEAMPETMPAMDKTLVAQWQRNNYVITFDSAGGSSVNNITVAFDNPITLPSAPTRQGYTFAGWNPAVPSKMPAANLTVKASWTISEYNTSSNAGALSFWYGLVGLALLVGRRVSFSGHSVLKRLTQHLTLRRPYRLTRVMKVKRVLSSMLVVLLVVYCGASRANDSYMGLQSGNVVTDVTALDIEQALAMAGFGGKAALHNDSRPGHRLYVGKSLGYGIAAELAWVDLANVQTRFTQLPSNVTPLDVRRFMTESGSGLELSLIYTFAEHSDLTPTFRLGGMQMDSRYLLDNAEANYQFKDYNIRMLAAAGVRYRISERWNVQLNYNHIDSRPYSTSFVNVGVEYRF
jgi:uncharacterized repeat protein (TIGR02543 family)